MDVRRKSSERGRRSRPVKVARAAPTAHRAPRRKENPRLLGRPRTVSRGPFAEAPFPPFVDNLDLSMLRAMYPDRRWSVWGIDPRVTVQEIARSVGLGRNAARLRLRRWREEGFWHGVDVWPNPRLFGVGVARFELLLTETQDADEVLGRVGALEGALRAYTGYGDERSPHPGTSVSILCVDEHPRPRRDRRIESLRRLSPDREVRGPFVMRPPTSTIGADRLDWRIILAARRSPSHSVRKLATTIGQPERRVRRHWDALVEGRAILYIPNIDWSRSPSIVLHITCDSASARSEVEHSVELLHPDLLPLDTDPAVYGGRHEQLGNLVVVRIPVESAAAVQQAIARVLAIPHVRRVSPDYPLRARSYGAWFDARLEAISGDGTSSNDRRR